MQNNQPCPVRPSSHGFGGHYKTSGDREGFVCKVCGRFEIVGQAHNDYFKDRYKLSDLQRAVLSHKLITVSSAAPVIITMEFMKHFERNARLPTPPEQATNLIRLIGDHFSETGEGYVFGSMAEADVARVGALNLNMLVNLRKALETRGDLQELNPAQTGLPSGQCYGLTLDGWERYEAERHGQVAGRYGFIAMKFYDDDLERLVENRQAGCPE